MDVKNITNDKIMHKFVFGKDVQEKLENCELDTLFCTKKKNQIFSELFDLNKINTIIIEPIVKNDIGDDIYKYDQMIGVTYY